MSTAITKNEFSGFQNALNSMFQKNSEGLIAITPESGIVVSGQATPEQIQAAMNDIKQVSRMNYGQRRLIDRYLGQLICSYSALTGCDWTEAISTMNLVDVTGKAFKSLVKLPRMVSVLPDEAFMLPGLTTSHYDAATSFAGPKDVAKLPEFNAGRMDILRAASEAPDERQKGWVIMEMRKLQTKFDILPSRRAPISDIRKAYEVCSQALLEWNDEDYEAFGVTKAELRDRWEGYKNELIEKDLLSDNSCDPTTFTLPWRLSQPTTPESNGPIIEAETA